MTRKDDPFDEVFRHIDQLMNKMMDEVFQGSQAPRQTHAGTHHEVQNEGSQIRVVADLPGVEKQDIDLTATEDRVRIHAARGDRTYDLEIDLPTLVDVESADASYNNGVLEAVFDKQTAAGTDIDLR